MRTVIGPNSPFYRETNQSELTYLGTLELIRPLIGPNSPVYCETDPPNSPQFEIRIILKTTVYIYMIFLFYDHENTK